MGSYDWDQRRGRVWSAGFLGQWGAAYFFGPHASLGAMTDVGVHYEDQRYGPTRTRSVVVDATAARVVGAVYF